MVAEYDKPQLSFGEDRYLTLTVAKRTVGYIKNFVHASNPTHEISEEMKSLCRNHEKDLLIMGIYRGVRGKHVVHGESQRCSDRKDNGCGYPTQI